MGAHRRQAVGKSGGAKAARRAGAPHSKWGLASPPTPTVPYPLPGPGWAGVFSGVPGCPRSRGSARPDGFPPPFGHCCRPGFRFPRVPCPGASLRPLPVPVRDLRRHGIAAGAFRSLQVPFRQRHRCRPHQVSCSGSSPGIAARLGSLRVAARASLPVQVPAAVTRSLRLACRRFAVPFARRRPVPPGSAGKWERLRLAPLPHASSLVTLPLLRSLVPPLRASWLRAAAAAARSFLRSGALAPRFRPLPATR